MSYFSTARVVCLLTCESLLIGLASYFLALALADVLGNAYLTLFFKTCEDQETLFKALKAYAKAVSLSVSCDACMTPHSHLASAALLLECRSLRRRTRRRATRICTTIVPT